MIPIVIPVPTLHERTADEKEEMLVSFLKEEGRRMGVDVSISQNAFHCMLEFSYENNIDELKTCLSGSSVCLCLQPPVLRRRAYIPEGDNCG